jgi:hypothetical protein
MPTVVLSDQAKADLAALEADKGLAKRLKAVRKALAKMQQGLRQSGLNSHEFKGSKCPHGDKLWEVYAQNNTPGAFRIFWCYLPKPDTDTVLIVQITEHP